MADNGSSSIEYPDFFEKGEPNCRQMDPDMFFPEPDQPNSAYLAQAAKSVCSTCPYVIECLAWALTNDEIWGIWGGTTERERKRMKRPIPLSTPKRWDVR
jgi:WhiB family redox-sensing transcriptional regulator